MAGPSSQGHKPRFDFTLTLGNLLNLVALVGGGLAALWTVAGQFTEIKYAVREVATELRLTVQRLEQKNGDTDRRLQTLERQRNWRGEIGP